MPVTDTATLIISCKSQGTEEVNKVGKSLLDLDGIAKKLLAGLGVAKIIQFGKESVQTFSDLQEATQKFYEVFKGNETAATLAAKKLEESFGASQRSAKSMLSFTGDLLVGFGFMRGEALKLSEQVAQLGSDIASFSNYAGGAEGAANAITKAMLGETEAAKALGIAIRLEDKDFIALQKSIQETRGVTMQQARALAVLETAFKQKGTAMGDFERNINSIANRSRLMSNAMEDLKANVGQFIDEVLNVGGSMNFFTTAIKKVSNYIQEEGSTWAFAFKSIFIDISAGAERAFAVTRFIFDPIAESITSGLSNIFKMGQWVFDNLGKIAMNYPDIAKALFFDILDDLKAFGKTLLDFAAFVGKAIWKSIKAGLKGGSITDVIVKEWEEFTEKMGNNFGKSGGRLEKVLKKAGFSELKLKGFEDFESGWGDKSLEKMKKKLEDITENAEDAKEKLAAAFAGQKKGGSAGEESVPAAANKFVFDFGKDLFKFRETSFSAVAAHSQEAVRLQSRRFIGATPDLQKIQSQETKKISANTEKTAKLTENMLDKLTEISNVVGGLQVSTVG